MNCVHTQYPEYRCSRCHECFPCSHGTALISNTKYWVCRDGIAVRTNMHGRIMEIVDLRNHTGIIPKNDRLSVPHTYTI